MPRVADHVHDHCLAVTRDEEAARTATTTALERAPRSLPAALGHSRRFAVLAAPDGPAVDVETVPASLLDLAWLLAGTRPVAERSLGDLAIRHGLDRAGLGRALDEAPAAAAARADGVVDTWEAELRPVLLASLGPADCEGLRAVLVDAGLAAPPTSEDTDADAAHDGHDGSADVTSVEPPPATVGRLLDAGPAVAGHAEACEVCGDRLRAMASVRSLLARVPIAPAPADIRPPTSRVRRPILPPPADGRRRTRLVAWVAAGVVVLVGGALGVLALVDEGDDDVAVLTQVPARNVLEVSATDVRPGDRFTIRNTGDVDVDWSTSSPPRWLATAPASGRLGPRQEVSVRVVAGPAAPEGDVRAEVTVIGRDGSSALVHVGGSIERQPTVAATAEACTVTARVEDESEVAEVELWWRTPQGDVHRTMPIADEAYVATVPADVLPTEWWVVATDGRGNGARTDPETLAVGACAD